MNIAAEELRSKIATAEARLEQIESRPIPHAQRAAVQHQIKIAKAGLRDMRIQLAAAEERTDVCPVCSAVKPRGWLVCEPCAREAPAELYTAWQCARGHAHAAFQNKKPAATISLMDERERQAANAIISHLKQHGSAI